MPEQAQVLKLLACEFDCSRALAILKYLTDQNRVQEVAFKMNNYEINRIDIREFGNAYDKIPR